MPFRKSTFILLLVALGSTPSSNAFSVQPRSTSTSIHISRSPTPATKVVHSPSSHSNLFSRTPKYTSIQPLNTLSSSSDDAAEEPPTYSGILDALTGFSLSTARASIRATTGLSLTVSRTTLRGLTGVSMTGLMEKAIGLFPAWFRYFLQPFLVMYYTPLMILKGLLGPTKTAKEEALAAHERVIEGWKDAIMAAEQVQENWPLHVTDDGRIESLTPQSTNIEEAIVNSLDIASTVSEQ